MFNNKLIASKHVKKGECIQVDNDFFVSMEDYNEIKNKDGDIKELLANIKIVKWFKSFDPFESNVFSDEFKASLNA